MKINMKQRASRTTINFDKISTMKSIFISLLSVLQLGSSLISGQLQGGIYDFGQGRYGEKRGDFTPSEWLSIVLIVMTIAAGLALTISLCYWATKRQSDEVTNNNQAKQMRSQQVRHHQLVSRI